MAIITALEKLFSDVTARFTLDGTATPNVFGWREPAHRGAKQNRICWVPGDPSGAIGDVVQARSPGGNPRSIATLLEVFTVFVEAVDTSAPENEQKQYHAARLLFDAWFRAVYLAARNTVTVKSAAWEADRTTRRFGATIRAVCTVEAKIPDVAYVAASDVEGVVVTELDGDNDEDTPNAHESMDVPALEEGD